MDNRLTKKEFASLVRTGRIDQVMAVRIEEQRHFIIGKNSQKATGPVYYLTRDDKGTLELFTLQMVEDFVLRLGLTSFECSLVVPLAG